MGKKKQNRTIIGIVLLVAGIGLMVWGYQLSGSFGSQLTKTFSGALPDAVMYRYIGGAILSAVGFFFISK